MVMGDRPRAQKPVVWLTQTLDIGAYLWEQDEAKQIALYKRAVLWWLQAYILPMLRRAWAKTDARAFLNEWQHVAWTAYVLIGHGGRLILRKLEPEGVATALEHVCKTVRNCLQHHHDRVGYALWGHDGCAAPVLPPRALETVSSPSQIMPVIASLCMDLDAAAVVQHARAAWCAWQCPRSALRSRQQWQAETDWQTDAKLYASNREHVKQRRREEQACLDALAPFCSRACSVLVVEFVLGGVWCM